jgi:lipopolysaccharide transport protein LptA/LPS export ABC transporter protein LptC
MRHDRTRIARFGLLGLLVVVALAVAWGLRKPRATRPATAGAPATGAPAETTVGDFVYTSFMEGNRKVEVRAHAMRQEGTAQRLQGVRLTLPFVSEGRAGTAVISADEGLYQAQPRKATFKGHVQVRTDDGFELDTDSLKYFSEPRIEIRGEDPVAFRRGRSSGTSKGIQYREGGGIQLTSAVRLRIEDEAGAPTEIESGTASASREEGFVWFDQGVTARQGGRELRSQRLHLKLTPDRKEIERAAAVGDVDLLIGAGATLQGASGGGAQVGASGGSKRIRCRRLNMAFRAKGILADVSAVNPASLEVLPGPGDPQERRLITAAALYFRFDEQGHLTSLATDSKGPKAPPEQRRTVLVSEPLSGKGLLRRVESRTLEARFDPASGELLGARFDGAVAFSEPGRSAWAERASVDEVAGLVVLSGGEPRLVDAAQGSELRAREIRIGTRSHSVSASDGVRHTVSRRDKGVGPLGGDEPTVLLCRQFDYDAATRTAHYREQALMRSGKDEIRAPLIEIDEPAEGARRLHASGGVGSVMHPRAAKGAKKPKAAIETRSQELDYDEKARRVVYTGDVEIRQGDILTKSPEAIVLLAADGKTIDRVLAGAPVEVRQGARRATGERGTYTPVNETLVLVGEKVVLQDVDRRMEGRSLTFQVGNDRIRVDGRDEVRTEAVLERRGPEPLLEPKQPQRLRKEPQRP